jgi:hypothetical protein
MKFAFWFDYDHTFTFVKLFRELEKRVPGARASGIVVNDRYLPHAVEGLPAGTRLISFYELTAKAKDFVPSADDIAAYKAMDERYQLARVAYSDRWVADFKYDDLVKLYIFLIRSFRDYLRTEKPDVLVFGCIASQYAHLLYLLAREEGVRVVTPYGIGVEDLYVFLDNPYFDSPDIRATYQAMKAGRVPPDAEETAWARAFMAKIRAGDAPYPNAGQLIEDRKFQLPTLAQGLRYLRNYVLYYRNDFTLPKPLQRLLQLFWLRHNRKRVQRYFRPLEQIEGDFIFFPLHFEPEISTLFLTQYDQVSFIDIIIRQLPLSCRLVVKEHPGMLGQRDWRFFDALAKKYPNILFVDPRAGIRHLARRARAVVTFSGTVILEALILGRPVIYTSRSRFGGFGLGHFTQDIINFGDAIAAAESKVVDEADVIRMLVAIHRHGHRFVFVEPLGAAETLHDDNMARIADALLDHIGANAAVAAAS